MDEDKSIKRHWGESLLKVLTAILLLLQIAYVLKLAGEWLWN
jgi:hypothetical protein